MRIFFYEWVEWQTIEGTLAQVLSPPFICCHEYAKKKSGGRSHHNHHKKHTQTFNHELRCANYKCVAKESKRLGGFIKSTEGDKNLLLVMNWREAAWWSSFLCYTGFFGLFSTKLYVEQASLWAKPPENMLQ